MSKVICRKCKSEITWQQSADVSSKGYRCLSCAVIDYKRQNKRYREAIIEALHGLKTLPSVAPRLYLISILDKALEREG